MVKTKKTTEKAEEKPKEVRGTFWKIKNYWKNIFLRTKVKKDKLKSDITRMRKSKSGIVKELALYGLLYGSLVNYALTVFGVPFYLWQFPAYGFLLYLIKTEAVSLWRELWFRGEAQ